MSNSDLLQRSLNAVWHPCTQMKQHAAAASACRWCRSPAARASGCTTSMAGATWTASARGGSTSSATAIRASMPRCASSSKNWSTSSSPASRTGRWSSLSERLSALTGGALGHCFYASDGASATEIALKMSFHSWQNRGRTDKQEFLCLAGSYHGETVGALAVTDVALFKDAYAPLIRPASTVPTPGRTPRRSRRNRRSTSPAAPPPRSNAISNEHHLAHRRADRRAAHPVRQRHGDVRPGIPAPGPRLCDRYEVHLICDEIAVGCGRTGTFFAHEQAGIRRTSCACRKASPAATCRCRS
jgi:adenosylmethionine-8-amino-7-oxononanoate aminotransferase